MPIADPAPLNKAAAEKLYKDLQTLNDETVPAMQRDFAAMKEKYKSMEGVDMTEVMKIVDKLKAGHELIRSQIAKNSKIHIPGLEGSPEAKRFSLVKAAVAVVTKNWKGADVEKEIFDASREAVAKAGHVIGVDTQGGYFVPDQVIPDVISAIYTQSVFIAMNPEDGTTRVSVLDGLTGVPARIPKFDGGMIAYWIGEQQAYIESLTKMGNVNLTPKKLGVLTRLTDEMQKFAGYGFETLMRNDMQRAAAKLLDLTVAYGLGTENQPKGIIQYALPTEPASSQIKVWSAETNSSTYNTPVAGGVLNFDGITNMIGALEDDNIEPNASFSIISAPRYFRQLKQLKVQFYANQTANQAYLLGVPMLTNDRLRDLLGYDFGTSTQFPTQNNAGQSIGKTPTNVNDLTYGDVFAGNFSEVVVGRWSGIEIVDDGGTGSGFISDQTYVKFRTLVDVGLRQPRALIVCSDAKMR